MSRVDGSWLMFNSLCFGVEGLGHWVGGLGRLKSMGFVVGFEGLDSGLKVSGFTFFSLYKIHYLYLYTTWFGRPSGLARGKGSRKLGFGGLGQRVGSTV